MIQMNCMFCRKQLVYDVKVSETNGTMFYDTALEGYELFELESRVGSGAIEVIHVYCEACRIMYRPPE